MIVYPRKCLICEHVANNPAMFHFHKQIHEPIPTNVLCELGCNQLARFRKTNGRLVCSENSHHCPSYLETHSNSVKHQWSKNEWSERRHHITTIRSKLSSEQLELHKQAGIQTKRARRIATETSKGQRSYSRAIIYHSRKTYEANKKILNPHNLPIGQGKGKYSIDHKVSRHVGWLEKIPVDVMSSIHNLEIILNEANSSKSIKCSMTPSELLQKF